MNTSSGLLTKNKIHALTPEDQRQQTDYLQAVQAFARLTYESVYVIDYEKMGFEYVSENPLFLCGYSVAEVMEMGYDFYFKNVPAPDLELLNILNDAGFNFFETIPVEERKLYSITYDFHLINKDGKSILINHKLTPLVLTSKGKMWKSMCIVSLSHHKNAGNVTISKEGVGTVWSLDVVNKIWRKSAKPNLSERETEILRLHAQGLTIQQIADKIFVSPDTVKYHRRHIFETLGVNNMIEALSYAVHNKIL